jgi:hypothetical protein
VLYLLWAVPSIWLCAVFDICYSLNFGFVLYLLCAIPSILAVCYICCVLFPRFWLCSVFAVCYICYFAVGYFLNFVCVLYLLWAIPSILLCAIFVVCYSVSVLARACTRARLCAVFALCYALNFDCVLFLLYAIPSIWTVCYICCVLFPIWLCAMFAVGYSPQFGCVLYLLCAIPSISAVCGCFCCGLFPQFWLYAIFAILRTPYILYYLRRVSRVCLPGGVQLVVVSLALRKCVRKKSHPNLNSLPPGIGEWEDHCEYITIHYFTAALKVKMPGRKGDWSSSQAAQSRKGQYRLIVNIKCIL